MKTIVIAAILLAGIPLVDVVAASPATSIPPPCISCVIAPCIQGTLVTACVSYDSYTGCVDVGVYLRSVSGVIVVATPGESLTVPGVNEGPVHVGSVPVTLDPMSLLYEPYSTPSRTVTDSLCTGPASGTLGQLLS